MTFPLRPAAYIPAVTAEQEALDCTDITPSSIVRRVRRIKCF